MPVHEHRQRETANVVIPLFEAAKLPRPEVLHATARAAIDHARTRRSAQRKEPVCPLAEKASSVAFIATAKAIDAEMEDKIRRHQQERPKHWRTVEQPVELARILATQAPRFALLLVDCLTIFVANALEDGAEAPNDRVRAFTEALRTSEASIVLVSDEVVSVWACPSR
jgi:adenosyl cobinamide kinase/adenosyl cobinamide phosphate guanylyltransferase